MRVIAGTAGRTVLVTPKGNTTRPTTDRIKETLFNILQPYLCDAVFYDLFSGSGGIGIEALSRGSAFALFSDTSEEAIACIKENLRKTRLSDKAVVRKCTFENVIKTETKKADIIFMDPPYRKGLEDTALRLLKESDILQKHTLIIVEAAPETEISEELLTYYEIERIKDYGNLKHIFIVPKEECFLARKGD